GFASSPPLRSLLRKSCRCDGPKSLSAAHGTSYRSYAARVGASSPRSAGSRRPRLADTACCSSPGRCRGEEIALPFATATDCPDCAHSGSAFARIEPRNGAAVIDGLCAPGPSGHSIGAPEASLAAWDAVTRHAAQTGIALVFGHLGEHVGDIGPAVGDFPERVDRAGTDVGV